MQSDRELLEQAAKAIGKEIDPIDAEHEQEQWYCWNALNDDGDAFRLAIKLRLKIEHYSVTSGGVDRVCAGNTVTVPYGKDAAKAARRSIVEAAAEIGRNMP